MATQTDMQKIMARSHLRDADIARAVNVNPSTVMRWRHGMRQPDDPAIVGRLARLFSVPPQRIRPDWAKVMR